MVLNQNSILIILFFCEIELTDCRQSDSERSLRWQWAQLSDRNFIVIAS